MQIPSLLAWRNLALGLRTTVLRFPLPVALTALQVALITAWNHDLHVFDREDEHFRAAAFLLLALLGALGSDLLAEGLGWSRPKALALSLGLVLLLGLRSFTLPATDEAIWTALLLPLLPAGSLFVACAPFLARPGADDAFWDFNRGLWLSVAFGLLVGMIFALGLNAFCSALEALFELDIDDDIYDDNWTLGLGLVWPLQALSGVPKGFADPEADYCPTWARHVIGLFLVPFTLAYLLLLYAYGAKTLIAWDLPRGELGVLVAGCAAFGVATFLFAHPLRESGNLLVRRFCRFFHPALLVPAGLLLLAIAVRIEAYGVTEPRYAVAVFGLWLLGIALAFTFRRRSKSGQGQVQGQVQGPGLGLVLLPLSLACLLALGSFGPWGGFRVSTDNQVTRLERLLARNGLLAEGQALRAADPIDRSDEAEISAIASYLKHMGKEPALAPLFGALELDLAARPSAQNIVAALGLTFRHSGEDLDKEYYSAPAPSQLDVTAFQVYRELELSPLHKTEVDVQSDAGRYLVRLDRTEGRLSVTEENGPSLGFDLAALRARLNPDAESYGATTQRSLSQEEMTLESRAGGRHLRLILDDLTFKDSTEGLKVDYLSGVLLIGRDQP